MPSMVSHPARGTLRALRTRPSGRSNFNGPQESPRLVRAALVSSTPSLQKRNRRRTSSLNMAISPSIQNYQAQERRAKRRATTPLAQFQRVTAPMNHQKPLTCSTSTGRLLRGTAKEAFKATDNKAWTDKIPPKMNFVGVMATQEAVTTTSQRCRLADKSR